MSTRKKKNRRDLALQEKDAVPFETNPNRGLFAYFRESPFPPPSELEKYEKLCPGVAKQFFDNFVNQTNHRMELEKAVVYGENKRADLSLRNSFIIILSLLVLSVVLFILDKNGYGIGTIIAAIIPAVISFINSSAKRKEERETKRKNMGLTKTH